MSVNEKMTAIANAIRAKTGGTAPLSLDQMALEIAAIPTGGGGDNASEDAFISRTSTSYTNTRVTTVGAYCAYNYSALASVYLPAATSIGSYAFSGCTGLTGTVNFSAATSIGQYAFSGCSKIECVDLSANAKPTISAYAFQNCSKLNALIIRSDAVASLSNTNAFTGTLIMQGLGGIYVPDDLVDAYKASTNWATYASNICPISAYPVTDFSTISDSWDEILASINDGSYVTKYSVGDTKMMSINGNNVYVQLVAIDADPLADDSGNTAPTTWIVKNSLANHVMNSTSTNANGWAACEMRSWLRETAITWLPESIQSAIKEVTKTYYDYTTKETLSIADTVWIPSYREIFGGTACESSGTDYTAVFSSSDKRIRYNLSGTTVNWWLRSANSSNSNNFRYVNSNGNNSNNNANNSYGVLLGSSHARQSNLIWRNQCEWREGVRNPPAYIVGKYIHRQV